MKIHSVDERKQKLNCAELTPGSDTRLAPGTRAEQHSDEARESVNTLVKKVSK
jgi:hypothetical protein